MNWSILEMRYILSENGQENVVKEVLASITKSDEAGNSGRSRRYIALGDPGESFINYSDITEEVAIGWAQSALTAEELTEIEADIDNQIYARANPTHGSGLPWMGGP